MPQIPESDWLPLSNALFRALAFFSGIDPAAVKHALLVAMYEGKIVSRGREKSGPVTRLRSSQWDPDSARAVDWEGNCTVYRVRFRRYEVGYRISDIQVRCQDLGTWFKQATADNVLRFKSGVGRRESAAGPKPKKRRHRHDRVNDLIAEGVRRVDCGGETMHSAAKAIAKREWSKELAASETALVDQIRRGISEELKARGWSG